MKLASHSRPGVRSWCAAACVAVVSAIYAQSAFAHRPPVVTAPSEALLITADRMFDGNQMRTGVAVLLRDGKVTRIGPAAQLRQPGVREIAAPGGTVLPGFIDLHTHHTFQGVPLARVVEHGVTTVRDLGGSLTPAGAAEIPVREVLAGPILTVRGGYPTPVFRGTERVVAHSADARAAVRDLVHHGAGVIKVALEPGGSAGAPWSHHAPSAKPPWPMLSTRVLRAIVAQAHIQDRKVAAHLSGPVGVRRALAAGVDEWSHVPCDRVSTRLLRLAVKQGVAIVGTLDTQSHCRGVASNARRLVKLGARLLYGTDLAHVEVPHGIDAQELHLLVGAGMSTLDALRAATVRAGRHLGIPELGRLVPGAPADVIVVGGDPSSNLKTLEYPAVVVSGGVVVREHPVTTGGHGHHRSLSANLGHGA